MFAMHKQIVISLADLRFVSIECPECKTVVTMDMQETHEFAQKHDAFTPKECPGCSRQYDIAIRPNVDKFQKAYKALVEIADRISFRGNAESAAL
jgi:phage FluMu protein Com